MNNQLTVLVPTHNRPAFLNRLLTYFSATSLQSQIRIIDSSDPERQELNRHVIGKSGQSLRIEHRIDKAGLIKKCRTAMGTVTTPYSIFCADDDFFFADYAGDCIDFLNLNLDYSAAMGSWVWLNSGKNNSCHQSKCRSLDDRDPLDRFRSLATRWFSTFYAIHRTDDLRNAWNIADDSSDYDQARVYPELMLGQIGILTGKLKVLPHVHMIFQLHDDNEHRRLPLVQNPVTQQALYQRFANALTDQMVTMAACTREEAFQILSKLYGETGDKLIRDNGRTVGLHRLRRNVWNQVQLIRDRISSDSTNVWIRRRLKENHPLRQTAAWKTAFEIAVEFPHGIEPEIDKAHRVAA